MNYIKKLEKEVRELKAYISGINDGVDDIRRYLNLPKFYEDTTVQRADIFNRLQDMIDLANERMDNQD